MRCDRGETNSWDRTTWDDDRWLHEIVWLAESVLRESWNLIRFESLRYGLIAMLAEWARRDSLIK
jgi:hypothetical protein